MSHSQYLLSSEQPLSVVYDTLLLDLDGTTYLGSIAAPNAPEGLAQAKELGAQAMYLTNNSGRSPEVVAQHLSSIGIPTEPSSVLNASQVAVHKAAELLPAGAKVLLVGGEGLHRAFEDSDFEIVSSADNAPAAVIQGLNEEATWADISEAVLAIHNHGAIHIATNMDATIPKERGPMVGNGSFVACVSNATGSQPINCGKPEPAMFEIGARTAHARCPLAVGDRLDTDIAGAVAAGIPSMHVLTGVSSARDIMLAAPECRPSYLGIDMLDVNALHPPVRCENIAISDGDAGDAAQSCVWVCGSARAWLTFGGSGECGSSKEESCAGSSAGIVLHITQTQDCSDLQSSDSEHGTRGTGHIDIRLNSRDLRHATAEACTALNISHNAYRAVVCAMWNAVDEGIIKRENVALPEFAVHR